MDILENLNENQKKAVLATEGPVMVIAGAGSGKTRVLTRRIAYLISLGIRPSNILAVTFTNKAATEMKERIALLTSEDSSRIWISTFHSMGARILRTNISYLKDYHEGYDILDEDDSLKIVKEIIKELDMDSKMFPAKFYKSLISKTKNMEALDVDEMEHEAFEKIYKKYQERLIFNNALDFDDLLLLTYEILKNNEDLRLYYQRKFEYILIDEFQDTNVLQYKLMNLLVGKKKNIFIVGDQDQSIYSFRGACVENINDFLKDYPDTKQIVLDLNYRSTKQILDVANNVIRNNKNRIPKNLYTNKKEGTKVRYKRMSSSYEETYFISNEIDRLVNNGYKYSDIAIFYRANAMSRDYEDAFIKNKIPYIIYGGLSYFQRAEVKDLIAYLKLILDIDNNWAFKRVINTPKRKIGQTSIEKIEKTALLKGLSMMDAYTFADINKPTMARITEFKNLILRMKDDIKNLEFKKYVDYILNETGYKDMLKEEGEEGLDRLDNLKEFKSIMAGADEYYFGTNDDKLRGLLDDMALKTDQDMDLSDDNKVRMMTYHQAKGLEFPIVFMVGMEQGIFPMLKSLMSSRELEEERRVCYVGISRAQKLLYLTNVEIRRRYGEINEMLPSMFIDEIDKSLLDDESEYNIKRKEEIRKNRTKEDSSNTIPKNEYKIGDNIIHKAFGDGVVKNVDGDFIDVLFSEPYGIKSLLARHPSIIKKKANNDYKPGDKINHTLFGDGVIISVENDMILVAFGVNYGIKKLLKNHASIKRL